jgi:hypothetical protein
VQFHGIRRGSSSVINLLLGGVGLSFENELRLLTALGAGEFVDFTLTYITND